MVIDTVDTNDNSSRICHDHLKYVKDEDFNYDYSIDDLVIVRTTEFFPFNHEILSPKSARAVEYEMPQFLREYVNKVSANLTKEEKKLLEDKLSICVPIGRDTVHFCINGLVGSHMYGDFSGRPFIIIEPLKYHIDNSLKSMNPSDTFFTGKVSLSDETVLIIKEEYYNLIKDDPRYVSELEKYNIFLYRGNEQASVFEVLDRLGYDSFKTSNSSITPSSRNTSHDKACRRIDDFLIAFTESHGISREQHWGSDSFNEENRLMNTVIYNAEKEILCSMVRELNLGEEYIDVIDYYYNPSDEKGQALFEKYGRGSLANINYNITNKDWIIELIQLCGIEKVIKIIERINARTLIELNNSMEDEIEKHSQL